MDRVSYNNRSLFSQSWGGYKSEIGVLVWLGSGESSLVVCRWLSYHCVLTWQRGVVRSLVSHKAVNHIMGVPPLVQLSSVQPLSRVRFLATP